MVKKQQQQQQQQKLNFDHKNLQIACGLLYKRSEMKRKPLKNLAFTLPLLHAL